jgi:hypothetical protein
VHPHHHHRRASGAQDSAHTQQDIPFSQALGALGQALQSGSLSSAQLAYATLQQDLQQFLPGAGAGSSSNASATSPASGGLSINV